MQTQSLPTKPVLLDLPESIESDRLIIRPPRPGDGPMVFEAVRESLVDLRRFPASMLWALAEPSIETSEEYCREACASFLARRDLPLLLLLKESGAMVGSSGLHRINWKVPRFEVGFWGRAAFRGKGLVSEGVGAIANFAFGALRARRVEALCDDANERSWKVCERLGFTLEGTLRNERVDPNGTLRHTRIYAKVI